MALVFGFGGMCDHDGSFRFDPKLPEAWSRLRFRLTLRGQKLLVDVRRDATTYSLREGDGLDLAHRGEALRLTPDEPSWTGPNSIAAAGADRSS